MTRAEAAELLGEYRGACADVSAAKRDQRAARMIRRDSIMTRILDAMCGEEQEQARPSPSDIAP